MDEHRFYDYSDFDRNGERYYSENYIHLTNRRNAFVANNRQVVMSPDTYNRIIEERNSLINIDRVQVLGELKEAWDLGNTEDRSELASVKNKQEEIERRIQELNTLIANARVIDYYDRLNGVVEVGSCVKFRNTVSGYFSAYCIVYEGDANVYKNRISINTPIGQALLGHMVGDVVEIQVPRGMMQVEIVEIDSIQHADAMKVDSYKDPLRWEFNHKIQQIEQFDKPKAIEEIAEAFAFGTVDQWEKAREKYYSMEKEINRIYSELDKLKF